jgi:hypothetical protein
MSVYLFELGLELPMSAMLLPSALAVGGVGMLVRSAGADWRLPRKPAVLAVALVAIYAVVVWVGLPTLDHVRPTAIVARALRDHSAPQSPAGIYQLEQWRASLRYYAERPLARLETRAEIAAFLADERPRYVIMRRRDFRALRGEGLPIHDLFHRRAVIGTARMGAGLRRQLWGELIIATNVGPSRRDRWLP